MLRSARLFFLLMAMGPTAVHGAAPVGLQGVSQISLPEGVVELEVWAHPDGDRLVALTAEAIYAVSPVENTSTLWMELGGNDLGSVGEHVYICGPTGLTKLHKTSRTRVWEGGCEGLELGASLWLQSGGELIALGWTGYQELRRLPLEEGYSWGLTGGDPVQWRGEPSEIRVHSEIGLTTINPEKPIKTVISGSSTLKWLLSDGGALVDSKDGILSLEPAADQLLLLEDREIPYVAVYEESRAIGLLSSGGATLALLPTMTKPDRVVAGDFDHDGCLDFVVSGSKAAWVQGRCEPQAAAALSSDSKSIETLILGDDWSTHELEPGEKVELRLEVSEGELLSASGLPAGVGFADGILRGSVDVTGTYMVTVMVSDLDGGISARGFSLRVGGSELVEAVAVVPEKRGKKNKAPGQECFLGVGAMIGMASARTDWLNLTGEPRVFGSPTVSFLCGRETDKKLSFVYGADSTPTALISEGQLKLAMGTVGMQLGSAKLGAGLYVSLGLVSVATGARVVWLPAETKRGARHGVELRVGWLAATPDAGEISVAYSWQLGKRSRKDKR